MQIALFGGSFDPPHQGHQFITQQLLAHKIVDQVWFVPVKHHPFQKSMTDANERVAMLEEIVQKLDTTAVRIERYEVDHPETSYSWDTLNALSAKYSEHTFSWVIGSDNLASFGQWHKYQELLQKFPVFVYPRQGFPTQPLYPGMIFLAKFPEITVSATDIRQKVQKGESIKGLVTPEVEDYIHDRQLYRAQV